MNRIAKYATVQSITTATKLMLARALTVYNANAGNKFTRLHMAICYASCLLSQSSLPTELRRI